MAIKRHRFTTAFMESLAPVAVKNDQTAALYEQIGRLKMDLAWFKKV